MAVAKHKSETVSKRPPHEPSARHTVARDDERVRRTRARIDAAFVELLHRRAYGDIRVSSITKKAGVGRATFYAHYTTKDDLLRSQFERVVGPMLQPAVGDPATLDATHFFTHVGSAPQFYKAMTGPNSGSAPRVLRDCFERRIREILSLPSASSLKDAARVRVVASALIAVVECWLDQGAKESPQHLQVLFAQLAGPKA